MTPGKPPLLRPVLPTASAALLVFAGCGDGSGAAPREATVRDSLGVSIVENPAAAESAPVGWLVSEAPDVVVGTAEGDPAYQFFRVQGAAVLPDGRIDVSEITQRVGIQRDRWRVGGGTGHP